MLAGYKKEITKKTLKFRDQFNHPLLESVDIHEIFDINALRKMPIQINT